MGKTAESHLTDEEILKLYNGTHVFTMIANGKFHRNIAKAQRKKLLGWLDETCREHNGWLCYRNSRGACYQCKQALLKEHEVE